LRCGDGTLYTGVTNDLARRVEAHAHGRGARYTRSRLPVVLAWSAPARGRGGALRREAAIKRLTRAEKLALVACTGLPSPPGRARLRIDTHRARAGTMRNR
jgi:putative endonuclease